MPNEVLDNLSNQVPILLIGTFLSLSDAGHYGLAIMILSAPAALLGQAVGQSFLQYLGNHGDDARLIKQLMMRIWLGMAVIAFVPFGLVFLMGDKIFEIAFGSNWSAAGSVAQALALLLFVRFVSSPTSTVYLKLGMQKEQWRFCLAAAIYRTAAYSLAALNFSLLHVIWVHVATEVIFIILYNFTALRRLQADDVAKCLVK
jgi:O-antigen/teichoic acid export membrane protein